MPCYRPRELFRAPGGGVQACRSGSASLTGLIVPCGTCVGCRLSQASVWATRCQHEASQHARNCMLTLTYDQRHVPKNGSLDKTHLQKFWKAARKKRYKIRYMAVGEYGDVNKRPHYHACVFGEDWRKGAVQVQHDRELWTNRVVEEIWGRGFVSMAPLNFQTAAYVARYVLKKQRAEDKSYRRIDLDTGEEFYVEREFATMSRRPGIGSAWFDKYVDDVFPADECVLNGRAYRVPRYYDEKFKKLDPEGFERIRDERAKNKSALRATFDDRDWQHTGEELATKRNQARQL